MQVQELFAVMGVEFDQAQFRAAYVAIDKLALGYAALGAAVAASAFAFYKTVNSVAEAGFEIQRTADKLGVSTDALQEWRYAARVSGVDAAKLEIGMQFLATKLNNAAHGSYEAQRGLAEMGVHSAFLNGKLKPLDVTLTEISKKFQALGPQAQRTAAARFGFGRAGAGIIPLLEQGPEKLQKLFEDAHKSGVVMGKDLIDRSIEYRKNILLLGEAFSGLKIAMFGQFVNANQLIVKFTEWINNNRLQISIWFKNLIDEIGSWANVFIRTLRLIYEGWRDLLYVIDQFDKELNGVLWPTVLAIGAAFLAAFNPILSLITAISLVAEDIWVYKHGGHSLIGAIIENWDVILEKLKEKIGEFTTYAKKELSDFGTWFIGWISDLSQKFTNTKLGKLLTMDFAVDAVGTVSDKLADLHLPGAALNGGIDSTRGGNGAYREQAYNRFMGGDAPVVHQTISLHGVDLSQHAEIKKHVRDGAQEAMENIWQSTWGAFPNP